MKKFFIYLSIFSVIVVFAGFLTVKYVFFNYEDLQGDFITDTHISILGDYVFYESKNGLFGKATNLKNNEEKIIGIGLYNVKVHDDEIYYFAQRTPNPESFFRQRNINSLFERKVTPNTNRVGTYKFYDDLLYFEKRSYSTDADGNESGYIYKMNLDTKQIEEVISQRTEGFDIVNDTLYYIRHSEEGYDQYSELLSDGIFSYSLKNGEKTKVVDGWIGDFAINGNDIVYSEYTFNCKYSLLWLSRDLNKTTEISNDVTDFKLYSENLCFIEGNTPDIINIFNLSSCNKLSVVAKNIDNVYGFVLHENSIYYYDQKHNLCVINVN